MSAHLGTLFVIIILIIILALVTYIIASVMTLGGATYEQPTSNNHAHLTL